MAAALEALAELVRRESGLALDADRMPAFAEAARRAAPGMDPAELVRVAGDPDRGPALVGRLIDEATVSETFFFRHVADFAPLDWLELVDSARSAGRSAVRVWSAACSSGEEAYTLAIIAAEALGTRTPPVSVLGTDISEAALRLARRGSYGARSVRGVPIELRERYFEPNGREVDAALRARVRFERHNLVQDPPPEGGDFDLVVCRNVLIYFPPATSARVVAMLRRALARRGKLVLGTADRLCDWAWGESPTPPIQPAPARSERRRRGDAKRDRRRQAPARRSVARSARPPRREPAPAPVPEAPAESGLALALEAADAGRLDEAIGAVDAALAADPLDARAHFVLGVAELARGAAQAAISALRRSLYLDPTSALAAFKLGRAHDAIGQHAAARRAYAAALRALEQHPEQPLFVEDVDAADLAAACQARLDSLMGAAR